MDWHELYSSDLQELLFMVDLGGRADDTRVIIIVSSESDHRMFPYSHATDGRRPDGDSPQGNRRSSELSDWLCFNLSLSGLQGMAVGYL